MMKRRSVVWQEKYERSRYLKSLSQEALTERLRWLIENMLTLTDQGQIGAEMPDGDQERLWIAFTHTHQEFQMRGEEPPDKFLANAKVPRPSYPSPPVELIAYRNRKRESEQGQGFKFGEKEHLDDIVNNGRIKLRPASYYKDPSLNYAVADDELHFTLQPSVSDLRLVGVDGTVTTTTLDNAVYSLAYPSDFYVYCMTTRYALRLFQDFQKKACLIIYDLPAFVTRVQIALNAQYPEWTFLSSRVLYVDPNNPGASSPVIPLAKHLRFTYQQEFRLILHPPTPIPPPLPDVDITITPCDDIAEVIVLPN